MWMHVNDQTSDLIATKLSEQGHTPTMVIDGEGRCTRMSVIDEGGASGSNIRMGNWIRFGDDGQYQISTVLPPEMYDMQLERCKTLAEVIQTGVGAASMCWGTIEKAGVFDSTRAKDVSDQIYNAAQKFLCPEHPIKTEYTVEIAGQTFTKEQWDAVKLYIEGTRATVVDGATVLPS